MQNHKGASGDAIGDGLFFALATGYAQPSFGLLNRSLKVERA